MTRVLVVGAINVDLVVAVDELPGPGRTVVGRRLERHGGGKGANAAVAAARVGADVTLVGAVGDDDAGAAAIEELSEEGVDTSAVARVAREPTGAALIVVDRAGENQIAVGAGANAVLGVDHVEAAMGERLAACGCVLVSTEVAGEAVVAAVRAAVAAGVSCVLNPAPVTPSVHRLLRYRPTLTPLAARIAGGEPVEEAVRWAVTAASLSVTTPGARDGMPSATAIEAALVPPVI